MADVDKSLTTNLLEQIAALNNKVADLENRTNSNQTYWSSQIDSILFEPLEEVLKSYENVVDRATLIEMEVAKAIAHKYPGMAIEWQLMLAQIVAVNIEIWKIVE